MPACENCDNTWTWKQTLRKTFTLYPDVTCPYCGEVQYQTDRFKMQGFTSSLIILIPFLLNLFLDIPGVLLLSLFPILAIIYFLVYPFLVVLRSEHPLS